MATFRRLALATPDKLPKVYWACQVGMLEILQHWDAISRIVVGVERLRSTSPDLGGGFRVQLEAFQPSN